MKASEKMNEDYKYGFVTDIGIEDFPKGLNEDIIRLISERKEEPEWLLEFRLKGYRQWLKMQHPKWQYCEIPPVDFQALTYFAKPKSKKTAASLDRSGRQSYMGR
jgi:Fe-S cluster assembly protein SufB